jgi:hypothetical protein
MSKRSDALYIRDIKEAIEAVGNLADNVKETSTTRIIKTVCKRAFFHRR